MPCKAPGHRPCRLRDRCDIVERRDKLDRTEKRDPAERTEKAERRLPIEQAEPIEPIEQAEPIEPIERTERLDPIERNESSDQRDHCNMLILRFLSSFAGPGNGLRRPMRSVHRRQGHRLTGQ